MVGLWHFIERSEKLSIMMQMMERSQQVPMEKGQLGVMERSQLALGTRINLMTIKCRIGGCRVKVNCQEPLTLTVGRLSARPLTAVESSTES